MPFCLCRQSCRLYKNKKICYTFFDYLVKKGVKMGKTSAKLEPYLTELEPYLIEAENQYKPAPTLQ